MPDRIALIIAGRTDVLGEVPSGRTSACADVGTSTTADVRRGAPWEGTSVAHLWMPT
jgi:hypothetical protein